MESRKSSKRRNKCKENWAYMNESEVRSGGSSGDLGDDSSSGSSNGSVDSSSGSSSGSANLTEESSVGSNGGKSKSSSQKDSLLKKVICDPVDVVTSLLFILEVIFILLGNTFYLIVNSVILCLILFIEVLYSYWSRRLLSQINFFCYYVKKEKPKFCDLSRIFGIDFISRYFEIKSNITDNAVVELYLFQSIELTKNLIRGKKIGRLIQLGDNEGLLDDFTHDK